MLGSIIVQLWKLQFKFKLVSDSLILQSVNSSVNTLNHAIVHVGLVAVAAELEMGRYHLGNTVYPTNLLMWAASKEESVDD